MRVVVADLDPRSLDGAVADLVAGGAEAIGVEVDVADAESVASLARRAREAFGGVHLLVNNAGLASAHAAWGRRSRSGRA